MIVAEITKDVLNDKWNEEGGEYNSKSHVGKQFDSEALRQWWGWPAFLHEIQDTYFLLSERHTQHTKFRLYDDDNELYYEGWLIDDDQGFVQQFVLDWAKYDSGCTMIFVYKDDEACYVQEVG